MSHYKEPLASNGIEGRRQGGGGKHHQEWQSCRPGDRGRKPCFLVFRRGSRRMMLFRGCPQPWMVLALHQCRTMIGLALAPDELASIGRLDRYSYVFVSAQSSAASAFTQAISDLKQANWSIDDEGVSSLLWTITQSWQIQVWPNSSFG